LLGRLNKPSWGLLGIIAAGFCLLALPPVSGADRTPTLDQLQAADASLAAQSRSAVLGLYSLDTQLSAARARLATLDAEARTLRAERASIGRQIRLARLDTQLSQERLADRLRFIYEHGTVSSLDVVMGAKSLQDAMTQLDDFNRVASVNVDVLTQLRSAQSHLSRLSHQLRLRENGIAATTLAANDTVSQLDQEQIQRTTYVAQLAAQRSLNSTQIAHVEAQARAADALSQQLTHSAPTAVVPAQPTQPATMSVQTPATVTVATAGGRTLTVVATAYDLPGRTATGLPVGWGVAAVDPSVIPFGTHIMVPGYGEAIAADTGSAIVGAMIDLWFPTATQAFAWGRRTVTVNLH